MFRKIALTMCLMGGCIWCLALVTSADSAPPGASGDQFKPVAAVESLMHGQMTFFKEIGKALKNTSDPDRGEEIEEAAEVLAELANVNRFNKDKEDYRAWATQLRDTALQLAHEADKKNADEKRMKTLFENLKNTCAACHHAYQ